jgi:folate-dependent tRNA-U54 methylase TrmFO/GidA
VKVQQFETKFIFSSQEVIDTIVPALDFLGYGLIYRNSHLKTPKSSV